MKKPNAVLVVLVIAQMITTHITLKEFNIILCEHPSFKEKFKPILESGKIECMSLVKGIEINNKIIRKKSLECFKLKKN